jgi:paraquat-inducible protein B
MATARPAIVGGFVLGGLALAVAVLLLFGRSRLFEESTRAVIFFQGSVAGLDIGGPVTFRGIPVGSVQRLAIHLSSTGQAQIAATVELLPDRVTIDGRSPHPDEASLERLINEAGLRAQLDLQSFITGQLRINLDFLPGTPADRVAADTGGLPQIPALPSDLERLRATLAELPLKDLAQTAQRVLLVVERLAGKLEGAAGPLLDSAQQGVDTATRTLDATGQAVTHLEAEVSHSLQEFDRLAADARQQLNGRGADLAKALESADRVARRAEALLASLDSLTASRSQFRGDIEAAGRDIAATAASMRDFARAVERDPGVLLRGRGGR